MVTGHRLKEISDFDYKISSCGEVYSLHEKNWDEPLQKRVDRAGYYTVRLNRDGRSFTKYVHRLLAEAFIPNPNNLPQINHKNGCKTDNRIDNLEWVTHGKNIEHAYQTGLISKTSKKVRLASTGEVFESIRQASVKLSIPYSTLKNYLNGTRKNVSLLEYC